MQYKIIIPLSVDGADENMVYRWMETHKYDFDAGCLHFTIRDEEDLLAFKIAAGHPHIIYEKIE